MKSSSVLVDDALRRMLSKMNVQKNIVTKHATHEHINKLADIYWLELCGGSEVLGACTEARESM
jgi:hypothetical protein